MPRKGFTLIETLLILALISLFIFGGITSLKNLAPKYNLERAVWEVRARLNQARIRSIWEGIPVRVAFDSNRISLEEYDVTAKRWKAREKGLLEGVTIESNNNPVFYPTGTVTNLATVRISNARGAYKITLAISGRIKASRI